MAVGLKQLARKPRRSIFGAFALLCVVALNLPLFSRKLELQSLLKFALLNRFFPYYSPCPHPLRVLYHTRPISTVRESAAHAYADVGALPVALATILGKGLINEHLAAKMLYPAAFAHNVFWAAACKIHILDGACHVRGVNIYNRITLLFG